MYQEISQYFGNLQSQGIISQINNRFSHQISVHIEGLENGMQKFKLGRNPNEYLVKNIGKPQAIASVASSKMYNEVKISTPPVFLLNDSNKYSISTIQQSVYGFKNAIITLADTDFEFAKIDKKLFGKFKWQMFYDSRLIQEFLKFMTPECFEQFQNMFLVDEMRTDVDRHRKNYFLYKRPGSDKYEGIIAIDLEQMIIFNYCGTKKDDFSSFLLYPYQGATPQGASDEVCYYQRANDIRELIQDGVLSFGNINTLTNVLKYDFPKEIKLACKDACMNMRERNGIITPVSRLWEYNQKTIGKDLGL